MFGLIQFRIDRESIVNNANTNTILIDLFSKDVRKYTSSHVDDFKILINVLSRVHTNITLNFYFQILMVQFLLS